MARISTYTVDTTIEKTDKVLGSNIGGQTKNFNMQDIAEWLTSTNAIGSPGCIPYKYSDSGPSDGEMRIQNSSLSELIFPTGDNIILQVSKFPNGGGQSIVPVLNTYLNKDIIISQVQDPSIFAVYNVTAIVEIEGQTRYRVTMDHVSSNNDSNNKGLLNNLYYNLVPWNGAQDKDFKSEFNNSDLTYDNSANEYYYSFTHNLGKFPSITVKISTGQVVEVPVKHINKNESRIFFKGQNSGTVYAN